MAGVKTASPQGPQANAEVPTAQSDQADAIRRIAQGLQEEMMIAMLNTLQTAAGLCSEICMERLHALEAELKGASYLGDKEAEMWSARRPTGPTWFVPQSFDKKIHEVSVKHPHPKMMPTPTTAVASFFIDDDDDENDGKAAGKRSHWRRPSLDAEADSDLDEYSRSWTPTDVDSVLDGALRLPEKVRLAKDQHRNITTWIPSPSYSTPQSREYGPSAPSPTSFPVSSPVFRSSHYVAYEGNSMKDAEELDDSESQMDSMDDEASSKSSMLGATNGGQESSVAPIDSSIDNMCSESGMTVRSFGRLLTLLSRKMAQDEFQAAVKEARGARATWGSWAATDTGSEEDKSKTWELRVSGSQEQFWHNHLRDVKYIMLKRTIMEMSRQFPGKGISVDMIRTNLSNFPDVNEFFAALAYQDLIMFSGPLHSISLEELEIAWVLRIFPGHVESLRDNTDRQDIVSLSALRKEITQQLGKVVKSKCCRSKKQDTDHHEGRTLLQVHMADLAEQSEEDLLEMGYRAIDLQNLQETLHACAPVWRHKPSAKALVHRALIVAGVCSADALLTELQELPSIEREVPANCCRCRLNSTLMTMGLETLQKTQTQTLKHKARELNNRVGVVQFGLRPVLVTAPHNIVLVRPDKQPQRMQEHTTLIADRIATCLHGSSLTWSRKEQYRTELHWARVKRRGLVRLVGNESGLLDPANRDPNDLETQEIHTNEWFQNMVIAKQRCVPEDAVPEFNDLMLHIDLHGCRGPPDFPAHVNIGLGAMQQHMITKLKMSKDETMHKLQFLGDLLDNEVTEALKTLSLQGNIVSVIIPGDPQNPPALSGAWKPNSDRHTQTQQALMFAGYTHSIQIEMSMELRKALAATKEVGDDFANRIWKAFMTYVVHYGGTEYIAST